MALTPMLVLSLPAFANKKYTAYDRFHGNGPYGEIPTKKEPIRTLGFTLPYNNYLLLTEFEVRTGSYRPSFPPSIYGPSAKCTGHKSKGKNEDP